jgi:hypothetical protein
MGNQFIPHFERNQMSSRDSKQLQILAKGKEELGKMRERKIEREGMTVSKAHKRHTCK